MKTFKPWRILHVDLGEPIPDLAADKDAGGLFIVLWSSQIPLGQLQVPAAMLPIPSPQLVSVISRAVAPVVGFLTLGNGFEAPLPVPEEKLPAMPSPRFAELVVLERPLAVLAAIEERGRPAGPSVSVVICTRGRPDHLQRCLTSMQELLPSPDEIIVVDNDPGSGHTRLVTDRFPAVRYIPEARPGLSAARNTGIAAAIGDIIAFTDDDVVVHAAWIQALRGAFADGKVMAVTGLVLPAELSTAAQYAFQTDVLGWGWGYRSLDFDAAFFNAMSRVGVPAWRLGAGANMAFHREAFERVGFFDERLGAGASGCSEDSELWYRLLAEGYRCRYWPSAVVFHHHREDWDGLRRQMYGYMRGHVTALFVQFERYRHWGNLYRAFFALPWHLADRAFHTSKRWLARRVYDPRDGAVAQPVVPQILGALAGYGHHLIHRTRRSNTSAAGRARAHVQP